MTPEESVQAGIDVKAKLLFPIHWGKFDLSSHNWDEPIKRFSKEAKNKNIPIITPAI
jgi:L-ascorbate metabolism protein UlaG (beta-lactamase superfamily)